MLEPVRVRPPKYAGVRRVVTTLVAVGLCGGTAAMDFGAVGLRHGGLTAGAVAAVVFILGLGWYNDAYPAAEDSGKGCLAAAGWILLIGAFLLALGCYVR